jgi:competence protein ComEC
MQDGPKKPVSADRAVFRPVIPLLLAMTAGILFADKFPGYLAGAVIVMLVLSIGLIGLFLRQFPSMLLSLALFFSAGYITLQPWVSPRFPDHHVIHLTDSRHYLISGIIDETPLDRQHTTRFVLLMKSVMENGSPLSVCGRIRVTVSGDPLGLRKGDEITFYSKIRSIRNFNNPGGFDYKRYLAFRKVWGRAYTQSDKISIHSAETGGCGALTVDRYRREISALIDRAVPAGKAHADRVKAVLKALLIGDKTHISASLRNAFNRAGISHLLAISGLHIGIVAFTTLLIIRWLVSFIRPLLWLGWSKKAAVALSFFPLLAYGILAGMSPSTQRAVIMVGVFLLGVLFDRDQDIVNTIAVAAMVILVVHPPSLFSISFQLSFAAVLSIVYGLSHVRRKVFEERGTIKKILDKIAAMALVTVFATLGTAPLVMYYFNQVSLIGLVANLIMVPVIGFAVVPVGLTSVFLYLFSAEAAFWFMKISAAILEKSLRMITFFSELPFAALKTVTPSLVEIGLAYFMLWGLLNWAGVLFQAGAGDDGRERKSVRAAALVFIIAVLAFSADVLYWVHTRLWHKDLRVTVLDVGQGNAALLELPGGRTLLIDGGGFSGTSVFDTGEMIIAPFLRRKKIMTVDTILLSHANSDHLNGLIYIAEQFNVKTAIINHEHSPTKGFERFISVLEKNGVVHPRFQALERNFTIDRLKLQILHPENDFMHRNTYESWRNLNNNSIVVKVVFGNHSFLFPGDIMSMGEKALVGSNGGVIKSDVLLVPHHGSDTSSSPLFLSHVDPKTAIVSAGWNNRFGFPSEKVLRRYEKMGCSVYRTDIHGAVRIWSNGESMKIQTMLPDSLHQTPNKRRRYGLIGNNDIPN